MDVVVTDVQPCFWKTIRSHDILSNNLQHEEPNFGSEMYHTDGLVSLPFNLAEQIKNI